MKTEHVVPIRVYGAIFGALLVLTLTTAGVAYVDLGGDLNTIVALTIAVIKAMLVILYFMHVRYSDHLTWIFVGAGFFWLLILLTLTMADPLTRTWISSTFG
jgi:cytochrome c oxidase subunit 4